MSNVTVIALRLPKGSAFPASPFIRDPFEVQLSIIETEIRNICVYLAKNKEASEWIIAWQEYGLTNGLDDKFINSEQKTKLKESMQQLTKEYPQLTIISGTVLTKRKIDSGNEIKKKSKIIGIKKSYIESSAYNHSDEFKESKKSINELTKDDFYLVRNTAYVFKEGICILSQHKMTPWNETSTLPNSIFKPGFKRFDAGLNFDIEICLEHRRGVLAKTNPVYPKLMQFILSDSIDLLPEYCISPFIIHIDNVEPIRLITNLNKTGQEVSLYSYDMFSDTLLLEPIQPQTLPNFILEQIQDVMEKGCHFDFDIHEFTGAKCGKDLLKPNHYLELLKSVITKYTHDSQLWTASKKNSSTSMKICQLKSLLEYLLLKNASLKGLFKEYDLIIKLIKTLIKNKEPKLLSLVLSNYPWVLDKVLQQDYLLNFIMQNDNSLLLHVIVDNKLKPNINQTINAFGDTLLHLAIRYQAQSIVKYLLQKGSNIHIKNLQGHSGLDMLSLLPHLKGRPVYKLVMQSQAQDSSMLGLGKK